MAFRDKPVRHRVRITLSDHALESVVWPKLRPVLSDYPDIKLELSIDNGFRNIVEERLRRRRPARGERREGHDRRPDRTGLAPGGRRVARLLRNALRYGFVSVPEICVFAGSNLR